MTETVFAQVPGQKALLRNKVLSFDQARKMSSARKRSEIEISFTPIILFLILVSENIPLHSHTPTIQTSSSANPR